MKGCWSRWSPTAHLVLLTCCFRSQVMDVLQVQTITLVAFFFTMLLSCLLPLKLVPNRQTAFESRAYDLGLSLANCLSAGVFLATFFVGLLPEVRRQFIAVLYDKRIVTSFPVTEFVVFLGFFFSVAIENLLVLCKRRTVDASSSRLAPSGHRGDTESSNGGTDDADDGEKRDRRHGDATERRSRDSAKEHVHHHHSHDIEKMLSSDDSGVKVGLLLMSLGVHSIFEGITLGLQTHVHALINLFVGVLIHECLVAFAVGVIIAKLELKFTRALQLAAVFASSIPLGQVIGLVIGVTQGAAISVSSVVLQALAAGTFIQVTFLEIIPEGLKEERMKFCQILFVCLGFAVIAAIPSFFGLHSDDEQKNIERQYRLLMELKMNVTS